LERREHTREPDRVKAPRPPIFELVRAIDGARVAGLSALLAVVLGCASTTGTIGAVLGQLPNGHLFVREVPPGLAAANQGVRAGDEILLIDGRDVRSMSTRDVHHALEGDVGGTVKLTLVRGSDIVRVTLRLTPAVAITKASGSP
jgi:S1-C subfamily serine protease